MSASASCATPEATHPGRLRAIGALLVSAGLALALSAMGTASASVPTTIDLGTAAAASVIAGTGVTNTGSSVLTLDLDTYPSLAISGFPPGLSGPEHADDGVAQAAHSDLATAYGDAVAAPSTANETGVDLGGQTLTGGVYTAANAMSLTGSVPLTLSGSASSVFIFQAGTTLTTGSDSSVVLTGGVLACNVFWQVGTSATIGSSTSFQGNILASTSISIDNAATIAGRALALNGAVTLLDDTLSAPSCNTTPPTTPSTTTPTTTTPTTTTPSTTTPTTTTPTTTTPSTTTAPVTTAPVTGSTSSTTTVVTPQATVAGTTTSAGGVTTAPAVTGTGSDGATLFPATSATTLAFTGMKTRPLLEVAVVTILSGTALVLAGGRRRTRT
jgi:hypothetical protein